MSRNAPAVKLPRLPSILNRGQKQSTSLILLESDPTVQYNFLVLRYLIRSSLQISNSKTLILCVSTSPRTLVGNGPANPVDDRLLTLDWTLHVPGYDEDGSWKDPRSEFLKLVSQTPHDAPITVIVDSIDTLAQDIGSSSSTYKFLASLLSHVKSRPQPSCLILPIQARSPLLPLLIQSSFSQTLTHLSFHPSAILSHLTLSLLSPPPPFSPSPAKFWSLFRGAADRSEFGDYADSGEWKEGVVEVVVRGGAGGSMRGKGVERGLEGWKWVDKGGDGYVVVGCAWEELDSLRGMVESLRKGNSVVTGMASTDQPSSKSDLDNLSFNLNLTSSQRDARAQVPLPYVHSQEGGGEGKGGEIYYDPDSADDLDDEDPDEDLDI